MVHPFLRMTIYGAIWYQGETNAKHYSNPYKCMFPAMIDDWRDKWYQATGKSTDKVFPFGFVQVRIDETLPIDLFLSSSRGRS